MKMPDFLFVKKNSLPPLGGNGGFKNKMLITVKIYCTNLQKKVAY